MREFDLLQHVYANTGADARVVIPPGDDMGMLAPGPTNLLAAIDQVVGGRHFDPAVTSPEAIGRKAVNRCLSDVAAMAGRPVAALIGVVLPPDFGAEASARMFDAMRDAAGRFDCPLMGGDISVHGDPSHPLTCSVTVLAEPVSRAVLRSGAQVGDDVFVTGVLGGTYAPDGLGHHLDFEPRIACGIALVEMLDERLHAMIDISDGLGRDAGHLAADSGVTIELDAAAIPYRQGVSMEAALRGGEDYELCFTATGTLPATVAGVPVTKIGRVLDPAGEPAIFLTEAGKRRRIEDEGWEHGGT
ncbi:MAG: thiamine-phosphate kinase [Planctomycetota bacterium]|jgi:thiamine-monophosphate kinase